MRLAAVLGIASILFAGATTAETIQGSRFSVGGWSIGAFTSDQTREFSHCTMSSGYRSGIDMYFAVSSNYTWRVGWMHPSWRLQEGQEIPIVYWIDDFPSRRLTATVAKGGFLVIAELPATSEVFDQFRRGYVLRVRAEGNTYAFNLTDTFAGLTAVVECVGRYKAYAAAPPPAPEVFMPASAAWPAALRRPASLSALQLAKRPTLN